MRFVKEKTVAARQEVLAAAAPRPEGACRHHWLIDTPSGPVSRGVCKLCNEERAFKNYLETPYWDDDLSLVQVSSGAGFRASAVLTAPGDEEQA